MINGSIEMNTEKLKKLREEFSNLKQEYYEVVGGNNVPLYFGRIPDSFQ